MKKILVLLLLFIATFSYSQNPIWKGTGVIYTHSIPINPPTMLGAWVAIDTLSGNWYEWSLSCPCWIDMGDRIQYTNTFGFPSYTPNKQQSRVALNIGDSLFIFNTISSTWNLINSSTINTDNQKIDTFDIVNDTLRLSLERDDEPFRSVDLSPYLDNTDSQTLALNGTDLSISNGNSINIGSIVPIDTVTLMINDSIIGYFVNGAEVGRDTIRGPTVDLSPYVQYADSTVAFVTPNQLIDSLNNVQAGIKGSGTVGRVARWSDVDSLGDSQLRDSTDGITLNYATGLTALGTTGLRLVNEELPPIFSNRQPPVVYFEGRQRGNSAPILSYGTLGYRVFTGSATVGGEFELRGWNGTSLDKLFGVSTTGELRLPIVNNQITYVGSGTNSINGGTRHLFAAGGPVGGGLSMQAVVGISNIHNFTIGGRQESMLRINPTINETTSGNTIRGILINPTFTSLVDGWKAIEAKGEVLIKGLGTTSATTSLRVEDSAGNALLSQRDDGVLFHTGRRIDVNNATRSVGIGLNALSNENQVGIRDNIAIGSNTMPNATGTGGLGSFNVAIGPGALFSLTTGRRNFALGEDSQRSCIDGNFNISMGTASLRFNQSGQYNIAIGNASGRLSASGANVTSSTSSVYVGFDARPANNLESNQIVIGYTAIGKGSNTAVIGNSSVTQLWLAGEVGWFQGNGTPEGVVTAPVGSFYSRKDGGAGTTFYVKESGTGNTGWVAVDNGCCNDQFFISNDTLYLIDGDTLFVDLGAYKQTISISNDTLFLTDGGFVVLPSVGGGDNWGTQVVESDGTLSGDGTAGNLLKIDTTVIATKSDLPDLTEYIQFSDTTSLIATKSDIPDVSGFVEYSDSLTIFVTPSQLVDSINAIPPVDLSSYVQFSDSLTTFVTPNMLQDTSIAIRADIPDVSEFVEYGDSLTVFTTPTQVGDTATAIRALFESGTYTPTVSGVQNIDSVKVIGTFKYMRIEDVVDVSGLVEVWATSAGNANTRFRIGLPIASDLTCNCSLTGNAQSGPNGSFRSGLITAETTADLGEVAYSSPTTERIIMSITFKYEIQ